MKQQSSQINMHLLHVCKAIVHYTYNEKYEEQQTLLFSDEVNSTLQVTSIFHRHIDGKCTSLCSFHSRNPCQSCMGWLGHEKPWRIAHLQESNNGVSKPTRKRNMKSTRHYKLRAFSTDTSMENAPRYAVSTVTILVGVAWVGLDLRSYGVLHTCRKATMATQNPLGKETIIWNSLNHWASKKHTYPQSYPNYHLTCQTIKHHRRSNSKSSVAHRSIIETGERFSESNPFVAGPQPSQSTVFAEHRFLRRPPSRSLFPVPPFSPPGRPKLLPFWGAFNLELVFATSSLQPSPTPSPSPSHPPLFSPLPNSRGAPSSFPAFLQMPSDFGWERGHHGRKQ
ncbi:hypothetical protein MUK42_37040 [Musa troglodytarum]|uniref:Uncharacterized protein n=1 Tax=Musa troglodytarum TaxID=320322 RepID=A0A9E7JZ40_9LILI|nr:hypothetical protein MUK42_37040 [Musa troglodytarum]